MKTFFLKLLKCVLIFALFTFLVGQGIHWYLQACYEHGKYLSPTPNILVVGDSQFETGINPDILTESYNCSRSSLSYKYAYAKLKYYCDDNNIDTVLLSLAYHSLYRMSNNSGIVPTRTIEQELSSDAPFIFNDIDIYHSFDSIPNRILFKKYEFMYNFGILNREWLGEIIYTILKKRMALRCIQGGFVSYNLSRVSDEDFARRFNTDNSFLNNVEITPNNENIYYLNKISRYCKNHDITLLLINTPLHHRLLEYYSPVTAQTDSLANSLTKDNIFYINFTQLRLPDQYFKDHNHLNLTGSIWFSRKLRDTINTIKNAKLTE